MASRSRSAVRAALSGVVLAMFCLGEREVQGLFPHPAVASRSERLAVWRLQWSDKLQTMSLARASKNEGTR
eukprot:9012687-Lingulodinium_polyedra.AAC.1